MSVPVVYRAYAEDGQLLYIGSSERFCRRLAEHRAKPWWSEVARVTAKFYDKRWDAYQAEHAAIKTEQPAYNAHRLESGKRRCRVCGGSFTKHDLTSVMHAHCSQK